MLDEELRRLRTENRKLRERILEFQNSCTEYGSDSTLFLSGPMVLFKWGAAPGRPVLYVSPNVRDLLGHPQEEFLTSALDYMDLIHPEDRERVVTEREKALAEGAESLTFAPYRVRTRGGGERWLQDHTVIVRDAEGAPAWFVGYIQDISERVRTEEELRRSRERLALAQRLARLGSWSWDLRDGAIRWSEEVFRIFERAPELGPPSYEEYLDFQHPEDRDRVNETVATAKRGNTDYEVEHRVVLPSGHVKHLHGAGRVARNARGEVTGLFGTVQDITARKEAERELQSYAERIALASEAAGLGIWEWNLVSDELTWDQRMYELYDVRPDEFSGLYEAWRSRVHPEDVAEAERTIREAVESGGLWRCDFRVLLPGGSTRHIQAAARAVRDARGQLDRMFGVNQDVTEAVRTQRRLEELASHDSLTGLLNRGRFMELAERELQRQGRYGSPICLIMFDADRFKSINDRHGHSVGDDVLRLLARTALDGLRGVDILGRIGGEEFAALLPETDLQGGLKVAERVRADVEALRLPLEGGGSVGFTISLGAAACDTPGPTLQELLRRADAALYRAKAQGRNRVEHG